MCNWIANAYYFLLYYFGFSDTDGNLSTPDDREKITFMLRRMKERMGIVWWVLSLGAILGVWTLCLLSSWWWVLLEAFQIWLFTHVLWPYKAPSNIWKG